MTGLSDDNNSCISKKDELRLPRKGLQTLKHLFSDSLIVQYRLTIKHNEVTSLRIFDDLRCIRYILVAIVAAIEDGGCHCNIRV